MSLEEQIPPLKGRWERKSQEIESHPEIPEDIAEKAIRSAQFILSHIKWRHKLETPEAENIYTKDYLVYWRLPDAKENDKMVAGVTTAGKLWDVLRQGYREKDDSKRFAIALEISGNEWYPFRQPFEAHPADFSDSLRKKADSIREREEMAKGGKIKKEDILEPDRIQSYPIVPENVDMEEEF